MVSIPQKARARSEHDRYHITSLFPIFTMVFIEKTEGFCPHCNSRGSAAIRPSTPTQPKLTELHYRFYLDPTPLYVSVRVCSLTPSTRPKGQNVALHATWSTTNLYSLTVSRLRTRLNFGLASIRTHHHDSGCSLVRSVFESVLYLLPANSPLHST
jgi:hypothetical protein